MGSIITVTQLKHFHVYLNYRAFHTAIPGMSAYCIYRTTDLLYNHIIIFDYLDCVSADFTELHTHYYQVYCACRSIMDIEYQLYSIDGISPSKLN